MGLFFILKFSLIFNINYLNQSYLKKIILIENDYDTLSHEMMTQVN